MKAHNTFTTLVGMTTYCMEALGKYQWVRPGIHMGVWQVIGSVVCTYRYAFPTDYLLPNASFSHAFLPGIIPRLLPPALPMQLSYTHFLL